MDRLALATWLAILQPMDTPDFTSNLITPTEVCSVEFSVESVHT